MNTALFYAAYFHGFPETIVYDLMMGSMPGYYNDEIRFLILDDII